MARLREGAEQGGGGRQLRVGLAAGFRPGILGHSPVVLRILTFRLCIHNTACGSPRDLGISLGVEVGPDRLIASPETQSQRLQIGAGEGPDLKALTELHVLGPAEGH